MALPSQIPLKLSDEDKEALKLYLDELIEEAALNRGGFVRKVRDWTRQYESVHKGEASFPWPKSANPKSGVTQVNTDTMFSVFVNVMRSHRKPWFGESEDPVIAPMVEDIEEVMAAEAESMNYRERVEPAQLDSCKIGSGVVKIVWATKTQRVRVWNNVPSDQLKANFAKAAKRGGVTADDLLKDVNLTTSTLEVEDREETVSGFSATCIPLLDWWYPLGYTDIQKMPWVAERFRILSDVELEETALDMGWDKDAVEAVKAHWSGLTQEMGEEEEETDAATGLDSGNVQARTFFEIWFKRNFKVDPLTKKKSGYPGKWVATYHPESKTIMGTSVHPNNNGIWPYFDYHYWRRNGKWLSRGIAPTLESDEKEINAIHKQRRDAATAANTVIGKARKDSGLNEENAQIWPMKILFMDDPEKDLLFEKVGRELDIQALIAEEQHMDSLVQKKTGLTDFNFGKDMGQVAKGRGPARNFMSQMRENMRRMTFVLGNWRRTESEIGYHILELLQQYAPFGRIFSILGPEAKRLEKFFLLPQTDLRSRLKIRCSATDETLNDEIRREAILLINNMLTAYYKQIQEIAVLMANPNSPPDTKALAMKVSEKVTLLMREVLEKFDVRQPERFLVDTPKAFSDLSQESQLALVKQLVDELKGKGVPVDLVDIRTLPPPTAPPTPPGQPPPIQPAPQGQAPPLPQAPPGPSPVPPKP